MGDLGAPQAPPPVPLAEELPPVRPHRDARGKVCNRYCPNEACKRPVHADRRGDWQCYTCGAKGGTLPGQRMYMTARPRT